MKKLLVFLSIFVVLFVSTIRPLQAEMLSDPFVLENGSTYYFVIQRDFIVDDLLLAQSSNAIDLLIYFNSYDELELNYDDYAQNIYLFSDLEKYDVIFNVYKFVYNGPTTEPLYVDDTYFWFDNENPIPPVSIYDTIYSLIKKFVFGNNIESGSHQDLIATLLSSIAVVFVFALPFLLVWKVIKIIMG